MGVGVRPTGHTLAALRRRIDQMADARLRQKVLGKLAAALVVEHRKAFDTETSPNGVKWAPLKQPRPGKILHRGGELERRATRPVFRGQVVEFSLPVYGPRQQFGFPGGVGRGHAPTPARPFMAMDPLPFATRQRLERLVTDTVREYLR